MSERLQLMDVWRRALDVNIQYYTAMGQLAVDLVKTLVSTITDLQTETQALEPSPGTPAPTSRSSSSSPASDATAPASTLVLEAEAGRAALGAFLVENRLGRKVSAPVVASAFTDPQGVAVHPLIQFEPSLINLEAGEQVLVRILAQIDESLQTGVRYRGEASVPGLGGMSVPLVLRRREAAAPVATVPAKPSTVKTGRQARSKAANRAGGAQRAARVRKQKT
jgi:hypothetical protein